MKSELIIDYKTTPTLGNKLWKKRVVKSTDLPLPLMLIYAFCMLKYLKMFAGIDFFAIKNIRDDIWSALNFDLNTI